jgi:anti-sigma factor RsiW
MSRESDWSPSPELLAAYEDGECEDSAKEKIEAWLAKHSEAVDQLMAQRQLRQLWHATTPAEPDAGAWTAILARIQASPHTPPTSGWRQSLGWIAGLLLAGAAAFLLMTSLRSRGEEPFPVATADEVEILSVAGADTHTLVVGQLPVRGPLELLEPGEVTVTSVEPDARDNMVPQMHDRPPMIWARLGSDDVDD